MSRFLNAVGLALLLAAGVAFLLPEPYKGALAALLGIATVCWAGAIVIL